MSSLLLFHSVCRRPATSLSPPRPFIVTISRPLSRLVVLDSSLISISGYLSLSFPLSSLRCVCFPRSSSLARLPFLSSCQSTFVSLASSSTISIYTPFLQYSFFVSLSLSSLSFGFSAPSRGISLVPYIGRTYKNIPSIFRHRIVLLEYPSLMYLWFVAYAYESSRFHPRAAPLPLRYDLRLRYAATPYPPPT
jgi:hypothetical protein